MASMACACRYSCWLAIFDVLDSMLGGGAYDLAMNGGIFLLSGERLVEMREQAYDFEELLQRLLVKYPSLLAGDQLAGSPRRWLLVRREAASRAGRPVAGAGRLITCSSTTRRSRPWSR